MKYLYLAALAVFLAVAAWGWQGHQKARQAVQKAEAIATQLEASNEALRALKRAEAIRNETLKAHASELKRLRAEAVKRQKDLDDALKAAPEWSDTPLPPGVLCAANPGLAGCDQGAAPGGTAR